MPAVVSDSSPLIYLTRLGCLTWLRDFYVESVLDRLMATTTFRLSEEVRAVALHLAGEDDLES